MKGRASKPAPQSQTGYAAATHELAEWFAHHVTLDGSPYTLDLDQTQAAIDQHQNTLVTARAGSGKTRVIVAKVAYLLAHRLATVEQMAVFMFNRAAAAEVNARIAAVQVDGRPLVSPRQPLQIASTFHKFALDLVKSTGERPQVISETEQVKLLSELFRSTLRSGSSQLSSKAQAEALSIVQNFITRAGQQFPGTQQLGQLHQVIQAYIAQHQADPAYRRPIWLHQLAYQVYTQYLQALVPPRTDFNLLLARATELLFRAHPSASARVRPLQYILIDEYQDFSYLFFNLVQAMRQLAPAAHLFAVGDDWQAINRFAGSDVDYFINFAKYFPHDQINLPLATNYRSDRRIVEQADRFMLTHYDPQALPAIPQRRHRGKIYHYNPRRMRFDLNDIKEDALGDGRYQLALLKFLPLAPASSALLEVSQLLKRLVHIIARHPRAEIMLLHRHNFTSYDGVTLEILQQILETLVVAQGIMSTADFKRQVRCMTMHKSKGLEAEVVILLEMDRTIIQNQHPNATLFEIFGDTRAVEAADQQRLLYVALTRAKRHLYLLSSDQNPLI